MDGVGDASPDSDGGTFRIVGFEQRSPSSICQTYDSGCGYLPESKAAHQGSLGRALQDPPGSGSGAAESLGVMSTRSSADIQHKLPSTVRARIPAPSGPADSQVRVPETLPGLAISRASSGSIDIPYSTTR